MTGKHAPRLGLYVFDQDCRITDNPGLYHFASELDYLICLYCIEPVASFTGHFSRTSPGVAQRGYLKSTLLQLNQQLNSVGQQLLIVEGRVSKVAETLVQRYGITHIGRSQPAGSDEQADWLALQNRFAQISFYCPAGNTLFEQQQLPFSLADLPGTFSAFRKVAESIGDSKVVNSPGQWPPSPLPQPFALPASLAQADNPHFQGGELNAQAHIHQYFSGTAASHYKLTRNALDGESCSTQFSPFLAFGACSVRQVLQALELYEEARGANESTYWIYVELLWREYFYWYAQKYQQRLFYYKGINDSAMPRSFSPRAFADWCEGKTSYPLVNALMKQLNLSGWMSNRGRQIVASCLIHELNLDWRYGAAYFQQRLIDYDVASNWGNWQYIAGVGADPRGGRHFNLQKQQELHDPTGQFVSFWTSVEYQL